MRYCGSTDELCEASEGSGGDEVFYDCCEDRVLRMKEEVVLVVFGAEGSHNPFLAHAPRGITLMNMSNEGDSGPTHYILVDDE